MTNMTFGERLIQSARQAESHSARQTRLRSRIVEVLAVPSYNPTQIKDIRVRLGLTQGLMGSVVGVSTKTIEAWEAGWRSPSATARRVLAELDTNPLYLSKIARVV